jgi:hypothetical protein
MMNKPYENEQDKRIIDTLAIAVDCRYDDALERFGTEDEQPNFLELLHYASDEELFLNHRIYAFGKLDQEYNIFEDYLRDNEDETYVENIQRRVFEEMLNLLRQHKYYNSL